MNHWVRINVSRNLGTDYKPQYVKVPMWINMAHAVSVIGRPDGNAEIMLPSGVTVVCSEPVEHVLEGVVIRRDQRGAPI